MYHTCSAWLFVAVTVHLYVMYITVGYFAVSTLSVIVITLLSVRAEDEA